MKLEELRLMKSAITDNFYVGKPSKDGLTWSSKIDVTNDFLACVLARWAGYTENITCDNGKKYEIAVKEIL